MRRPRFFSQIFVALLFVTFLSMLAVAWHATTLLSLLNRQRLADNLEMRARFTARGVAALVTSGQREEVDAACKRLGAELSTRFTVILNSGAVIGDTAKDPEDMENHRTRPEIAAAIRGEVGVAPRYSDTLHIRMLYVAIPIQVDGAVVAVTRAAIPETSIVRQLWGVYLRLSLGGLAIAALAASLSLLISTRFSSPLQEMREVAERFASGDLNHRLAPSASEEIAGLAEAMNEMAAQLDERLRTVVRQEDEQRAILASMVEGVLAIDRGGTIISLNRAAAKMMDIDVEQSKGRPLDEVVRYQSLHSFVRSTLSGREPLQKEVEIAADGERVLQANGAALRDASGQQIGGVVVLNDITRLRRLENVRREFVANVSHELKTPITSIKGYVETLRDGAVQSPENTSQFLAIVERQADRLNAIVDDLLSLSSIEREAETGEVELELTDVRLVLQAAVELCQPKARQHNMEMEWSCPDDLQANVVPPLIEQALANLIDNAIKYSQKGSALSVTAERCGAEVSLRVTDRGCGIAPENLPRLFERFYRVDKARSRKEGGTGLGLAIVKHVAQLHHGRVSVQSRVGEGSSFTIHLPTPCAGMLTPNGEKLSAESKSPAV